MLALQAGGTVALQASADLAIVVAEHERRWVGGQVNVTGTEEGVRNLSKICLSDSIFAGEKFAFT